MAALNVIFIIIDAARNYKTDADTRGKPDIIDKVAEEGVEFTTAVTAAPSTIMAVSAMMTGFPSYYIATNFNGFHYDNSVFVSLPGILKSNGYNIYSITHYFLGRKFWKNLVYPIGKEFWPKGLKDGKTWENDAVDAIFLNVMEKGLKQPFFLFLHYNVRWDPLISQRIESVLNRLRKEQLYDESILAICSDHGLPDPRRKYPRELARDKGHDLILTDDNILFPLCIKYPGCPCMKKVDTVVSSLDIMPTILDILKIPEYDDILQNLKGRSLLSLINGRDVEKYKTVKIRTDCRYLFQTDRITSIRGKRFKYVFFHDDQQEQFFDLLTDPLEEKNLIRSTDEFTVGIVREFREYFQKDEAEILDFLVTHLIQKFAKNIKSILNSTKAEEIREIFLCESCHMNCIEILAKTLKRVFPHSSIDFLIEKRSLSNIEDLAFRDILVYEKEGFRYQTLKSNYSKLFDKTYDLVIVPLDNSGLREDEKVFKIAGKLKANRKLYVDYNMNIFENLFQEVPFGSNPQIPFIIRRIYKGIGFYYYRRYWYLDDFKKAIKKLSFWS